MPIDMLLYCPNCGMQHVDAPDEHHMSDELPASWTNPPHRSHLCHGCRCIWRPADVPTNGVAELKTTGKADTWPVPHNEEVTAMPAWCPATTPKQEAASTFTWPPKACPCGSVQRDGCEDHGCKWERDPSLVPEALRVYATPKQEAVTAAVVASGEPVARVTLLTLPDGKKAKVLRALSEKWIVTVPDGTDLYVAPPPASTIPRVADHLEDGGKANA